MSTATGRILSGMRPTGRLHLGNYVGALENWVRLQDAGWTNFHMVADWHMLTTGFEDTSRLQEHTWEMVLDWLGAGLDPARSVIFVQSAVKEHAELHLLLSMLVSKARLERIPTLKDQIRDLGLDEAEGRRRAEAAIADGSALAAYETWIRAQGGDPAEVVANGADSRGAGLIVNSSRAILYADESNHVGGAARVARDTRDALNAAR